MNKIRTLVSGLISAALIGTVQAQIGKLPIANIDEITDHIGRNIDVVAVQVTSLVTTAEGIVSLPIVDEVLTFGTFQGKFSDALALKVGELLTNGVDVLDPALATASFGVSAIGFKNEIVAGQTQASLVFFAGNNFELERTSSGRRVIPVTASDVALATTISELPVVKFYFSGVKRVIVEVHDETGKAIETQDSDAHKAGEQTVAVTSNGFQLPMPKLLGKPGRVIIHNQDGYQQTFNLIDGALLSSSAPEFRLVTKARLIRSGIEFSVEGNPGEVITIETTTSLGAAWTRLDDARNFSTLKENRLLSYAIDGAAGRAFFRARVSK